MLSWLIENANFFQAVVTAIGIIVAAISVISVRATAKKTQTADLLFQIRKDKKFIDSIETLNRLHESNQNMRLLARVKSELTEDDLKHAKKIRYVLNLYERLSVGISEGIYDENMMRKSQYTIVTKIYEWSKPFIDGVRKQTDSRTAFQEFEALARRWEDKPLKTRSRRKWYQR